MIVSKSTQPTVTRRQRNELPPSMRVWVRLMRVFNRVERRTADSMHAWDLTPARFDVINHAGIYDGATQQELADALLVTKGNITQLLDALERDGLIRREKCGRMKRVHLTEAGMAKRGHAMARHIDIITTAMSGLTPDEQLTLLNLLRKLEHGLKATAPTESRN